ncbi:MAG: hypothetical protein JNJ45_05325 [Chthonomonas sp.]|nr:hypothetical protein [Chthonomonas sp.]
MDWRAAIESARLALPPVAVGDSAACGASVVHLALFEAIPGSINKRGPEMCANCGVEPHGKRSPFCGESCRSISSVVRQTRGAILSGAITDPERQLGLGQTLWHQLGGGFPHRLTLIPEAGRVRTLRQKGGVCAHCGEAATTFDHIKTACNRPINLLAVCQNCQVTRPFHHPEVLAAPTLDLEQVQGRVWAETALLPCDDPLKWDWRAYMAGERA